MGSNIPLANMFTLGVRDYQRQSDFYRNLGFSQVFDSPDFAVFEMRGAVLALFPVEKLAADARVGVPAVSEGIRFSIIINAETPTEVDQWAERAVKAGARLTKEPTDAEFFEGRDAYFADPEDNYWEVAWAPADNPVAQAVRRAAGGPVSE
jgi:uncharacterized protein